MTTATKPRARRKACAAPAPAPVILEKTPERLELEAHLVRQLKTRCGRQGHSPKAPQVGSLQHSYAFSARALDELGLVGTRRVSCWSNDSYASLCGRFMMIARDEHDEQNTPMRLRFGYDLSRTELWADGKLVATTRNGYLAANWLVMKMHGRAALSQDLLPYPRPQLP